MGVFSPSGPAPIAEITSTGSKQTRSNQTVTITNKDTEETITFSTGLKAFRLRARNGAKLQVASASGESGTNYETLWPNVSMYEEGLNELTGFKLYIQSSKDNTVVEIVEWT